jgi:hypothetical protein
MPFSFSNFLTNGGHIVADDTDDAGGIDEGGLAAGRRRSVRTRAAASFFSPPKMTSFSRRSVEKLMRCSSGPEDKGPANIPGVGRTADGPVDQVQGVGDRVEHHPRAAEHAGPLADRAGQAVLAAGHLKGGAALAVNLGSVVLPEWGSMA